MTAIAPAPRLARDRMDRAYAFVRGIVRFWVWFFFRRVGVRHPERVPTSGAVLLCINHPNNFIDSLLVGRPSHARTSVRFHVLVSVGSPAALTPYLGAYHAGPVKAAAALTDSIQWAMEAEVVNVERLEDARLVAAIGALYRDDLARD